MGRVMVVDDEADMRLAVRLILERGGYTVEEAASGEDACQRIQGAPPDLLLMDVRMPGQDGLETLEKIRESNKSLPVIIMTGYGNPETEREAFRKGANDYLLKPFKNQELLEAITKAGLVGEQEAAPVPEARPERAVQQRRSSWGFKDSVDRVTNAAKLSTENFVDRYYESGRYLGDDSLFEQVRHFAMLIRDVIQEFFSRLFAGAQDSPDVYWGNEETSRGQAPAVTHHSSAPALQRTPEIPAQPSERLRQDLSDQIHEVAISLQEEIKRLSEQIGSRPDSASPAGPLPDGERERLGRDMMQAVAGVNERLTRRVDEITQTIREQLKARAENPPDPSAPAESPQEQFHRILIDVQTTWDQGLSQIDRELAQSDSDVGQWRRITGKLQQELIRAPMVRDSDADDGSNVAPAA